MQLNETDKQWLDETWMKIQSKISAECDRMGDKIPYIAENGIYKMDWGKVMLPFWTNGFWAGILWQLYKETGEDKYLKQARSTSDKLNTLLIKADELHHDVGFMWLHTAVADYRSTGSSDGRTLGLHAANLLAGRYNPQGGYLCAWNFEGNEGWAIIDTMMNINLLYWASKETKNPRFRQIAIRHADKTLVNHFRPDGSVYHIAAYDPQTGELNSFPPGQGYSSDSAWSRGQAWALYGFALSYRHTGDMKYLDAAKRAAHYFLANVAQTDWVPLVDFRAPLEPVCWDTTAGVIAAAGLLELAEYVHELEKPLYVNGAVNIIKATDRRFCNWDPAYDSIVANGTGSYHGQGGRKFDYQMPIIYGDYFFIEAVLKLLGKGIFFW
ncbi:MAG: glycoside hydrolase family 88 protein [Treponema sp.]|jgi:unsaturated chondroitin disaccharide hydrolase|nr:glycoside hydrolase family 88 protein [Treponema sp.]